MTPTHLTLDAGFSDQGSLWLVHLYSEAAQDWIASNVSDDAQWYGPALVVEPRYVATLAEGMADAGLAVGRI